MLFREYERIMLDYLWANEHGTSGELWRHANGILIPQDKSISRASIIMAANRFVDLGILDYEKKTGKGGYHRVYRSAMTEEEIWNALRSTTILKMVEASGDIKLFDGKWEALF
jgi:predicted transcriptional regulator